LLAKGRACCYALVDERHEGSKTRSGTDHDDGRA
jgi:hypothetical protein